MSHVHFELTLRQPPGPEWFRALSTLVLFKVGLGRLLFSTKDFSCHHDCMNESHVIEETDPSLPPAPPLES